MTREDIFKLLNKHQDNDTLDIKTAKEMVNIIYDDHEAQLKAKDEITQDIKEAYELKSIAYDLLLEAIQLKDEEIERLKANLAEANEAIDEYTEIQCQMTP